MQEDRAKNQENGVPRNTEEQLERAFKGLGFKV